MLNTFLNPKSVAIIGASCNKKKIGWQILHNLKSGGFAGKIYPVNLKENSIEKLKAYKGVLQIKNKIDLAIIVIPANFVINEVKNCALANIKNIIIISAGFSEIGEKGIKMELEIKKLADKYNLNVLGPNCLGVINSKAKLNATFAKVLINNIKNRDGIAFVSQSGAIGSAALDWAMDKNIIFSYFVSLGNKAVLDENDFFRYFKNNNNIGSIAAYLEEIENGEEFMESVSALSQIKPVIVLKSGRTKAGNLVALSHTGSLAGSEEAIEAGLRRSGAIIADNIEELFYLMEFFKRKIKNNSREIYIVSNAGGPLVLAADQISKNGLVLGKFSSGLEKRLKRKIPELSHAKNPLDILGDAGADRYKKALEEVLKEKKILNLLILLTPQSSTEIDKTSIIIDELGKKYKDKLIGASFIGGASVKKAKQLFQKSLIVDFNYSNQAIKCFSKYINYQKELKLIKPYKSEYSLAVKKKNEQMDYVQSLKFLSKYKIPAVKTVKIKTEKDLFTLKYPIAIKAVGPDLTHKTDVGGIILNIKSIREAQNALKFLNKNLISKLKADNYCVAQEMVSGSIEIILGFRRDKSFGPIILVGAGGIYTEYLKDVQIEVSDINYDRALDIIKNLKIFSVLSGARKGIRFDVKSLAKAIVNLAHLAKKNSNIHELDINPLFIKKSGIIAADVRIII